MFLSSLDIEHREIKVYNIENISIRNLKIKVILF